MTFSHLVLYLFNRLEQLLWILLHPSLPRVDGRGLDLVLADHLLRRGVKHQEAGGGGALVDGANQVGRRHLINW